MGFNLKHCWKALLIGGVLSLSLASLLANAEDAGNLFNTPTTSIRASGTSSDSVPVVMVLMPKAMMKPAHLI